MSIEIFEISVTVEVIEYMFSEMNRIATEKIYHFYHNFAILLLFLLVAFLRPTVDQTEQLLSFATTQFHISSMKVMKQTRKELAPVGDTKNFQSM